ncbi:protein of unknown function [Methylorubrum extorquens]|uniref:Uncharacterized protein n=1 Tax=Methylorubrum extorquens TaxID=408 RepID=A0A2N9AW98_METEX|nr:protein of unknown function [Methylorubrum extorquens]
MGEAAMGMSAPIDFDGPQSDYSPTAARLPNACPPVGIDTGLAPSRFAAVEFFTCLPMQGRYAAHEGPSLLERRRHRSARGYRRVS